MSVVGEVELKVLRYLFSNPKQFIQHIQKGIPAPYVSTYLAVKRLQQKGYVEVADEAKTEKGNLEKRWKLSKKGLEYLMAVGEVDPSRCSSEYMPDVFIKLAQALKESIGEEELQKSLTKACKVYLTLSRNGRKFDSDAFLETLRLMVGSFLTHGIAIRDTSKLKEIWDEAVKPYEKELSGVKELVDEALEFFSKRRPAQPF